MWNQQRNRKLFLFKLVNAECVQVTIRTKEKSARGGPKLQAGLYKWSLRKTVSSPRWLRLPLPINQWASSG